MGIMTQRLKSINGSIESHQITNVQCWSPRKLGAATRREIRTLSKRSSIHKSFRRRWFCKKCLSKTVLSYNSRYPFCKYSQLHMSVKHDNEHERIEHMMPRLQQPHQEGLALCHRVILDSVAHRWVPARTPTVRQPPRRIAVGGPK